MTGYQLRSRVDGGEWAITEKPAAARHHMDSWADDNDLREYAIRSVDDDGPGNWSATQHVVITTPAAVHNVRVNREGSRGVRVHWDLPDGVNPNIFVIEAKTGEQDYTQVASANGRTNNKLVLTQPFGTKSGFSCSEAAPIGAVLAFLPTKFTSSHRAGHHADDAIVKQFPLTPTLSRQGRGGF